MYRCGFRLSIAVRKGVIKMVRVLIVDDEMMFRIGVKSCVNWNEYGCELVGEAADGRQALEMITELRPDLVFTDIKMPVMDGLELTRHLMKEYPLIKVIILSCYNDFEYVKEALQLGARDYIHKLSLKPSDLIELVTKMKELIEKEQQVQAEENLIQQEFLVNIGRIKESFLREALTDFSKIGPDLFRQKAERLGLRISYDHNVLAVLSPDDARVRIGKKSLQDRERNLFNSAFINLAGDIINSKGAGEVIAYESNVFIVIFSLANSCEDPSLKGAIKLIQEINTAAKKFFNTSLSAGISLTQGTLNQASQMVTEGLEALTGRFYEGQEYIEVFNPQKQYSQKPFKLDITVENRLQNAIEIDAPEAASEIITAILQELKGADGLHPLMVRNTFKEIIYTLNRAARTFGGDLAEFAEEDPFEQIDQLGTFQEIEAWLGGFLALTIEYIENLKSSRYRDEVTRVINYLKSNIARNLSLREASQIANMSEKYFCLVFKKETGKNYVEYVSELKTEAARNLLINPDLKTYEVAQQLGFENESYFSKTFKKYTGLAPNEYRKNIKATPRGNDI